MARKDQKRVGGGGGVCDKGREGQSPKAERKRGGRREQHPSQTHKTVVQGPHGGGGTISKKKEKASLLREA
jgi:hypothetical protein